MQQAIREDDFHALENQREPYRHGFNYAAQHDRKAVFRVAPDQPTTALCPYAIQREVRSRYRAVARQHLILS